MLSSTGLNNSLINILGIHSALKSENITQIPLSLLEEDAPFVQAVSDLNVYMWNSEKAEAEKAKHGQIVSEKLRTEIELKGRWSRLHLDAIDAEHFVAMLVVDLIPMIITRSPGYQFLNTDQLTRAICETLATKNPDSKLLKLIFDQGWFTNDGNQFSEAFLEGLQKHFHPHFG